MATSNGDNGNNSSWAFFLAVKSLDLPRAKEIFLDPSSSVDVDSFHSDDANDFVSGVLLDSFAHSAVVAALHGVRKGKSAEIREMLAFLLDDCGASMADVGEQKTFHDARTVWRERQVCSTASH